MGDPVDNLLDRLATIRDQAHDFGDLDLALTAHDARISLIYAIHLSARWRAELLDAYEREHRLRQRIADQVEIIRRMRSENDPAHIDPQVPRHGCG